jgi:hypothetical protein
MCSRIAVDVDDPLAERPASGLADEHRQVALEDAVLEHGRRLPPVEETRRHAGLQDGVRIDPNGKPIGNA